MRLHLPRHALLLCCLATASVGETALATSPTSASFTMERITISGAARASASASFEIQVTFAQEGPVGAVSFCNGGYGQGTGFWSVLGMPLVPVRLQVFHDDVDPETLQLRWSGSSPSFEIYRALLPSSVIDPAHLAATTSACEAFDMPPVEPDFVYYLIKPIGN